MCAGEGERDGKLVSVYSPPGERRPKYSISIANVATTHNTDMHIHLRGTTPIRISSGMIRFHTKN